MTYDPTDIYAAEPKLLSLSCFPTSLFSVVQPPNYDLIMASARYHRVPEEENRGRVSLDSSIGDNNVDSELLLSDPMRTSDHHDPPAKQHKFSFHPTLLSRSLAVAVFIMSCILLGSSRRNRNIFALVILSLAIIRNVIVIIHHLFSRKIRIRIEYRNQRLGFPKSDLKIPGWLKTTAHILVDILLVVLLIIAGIIATQGSKGWYYWRDPWTSLAYPGCVLLHIGNVFYLISLCDLGKPSNMLLHGGIGISFAYKDKKPETAQLPQLYRDEVRDVEAQIPAAGSSEIEARSGKTGADSPSII